MDMEDLEAKQGKNANAKFNGDFFLIETQSGHGMLIRDCDGAKHYLASDASDESLGTAVLDALFRSRFFSIEETRSRMNSRRVVEEHAAWVQSLMTKGGYNNKRALFDNMASCSVKLVGQSITISPSVHEGLDTWMRRKSDNLEDVVVPATSTAAQVGAALRMGFSRCK
jgi:hypothetical protein